MRGVLVVAVRVGGDAEMSHDIFRDGNKSALKELDFYSLM